MSDASLTPSNRFGLAFALFSLAAAVIFVVGTTYVPGAGWLFPVYVVGVVAAAVALVASLRNKGARTALISLVIAITILLLAAIMLVWGTATIEVTTPS